MKITWSMIALVKRVMFSEENKLFTDLQCEQIIKEAYAPKEQNRLQQRIKDEV